jgi:hypothetical protein
MKTELLLVMCVSMFLVFAAAEELPPNVISQTMDSVSIEFECNKNTDCLHPGERYCGDGQVKSMKCTENVCDVICQPLNPHSVDEEWTTGTYTVTPTKRVVGQLVSIKLKDSRNQKPLIWDVEVYYGGKWEGALTVLSVFTEQILQGATLVAQTTTDRMGVASYTPDKPGQYYFKTMGKYIKFLVGDASGNIFNCSNGVCETALGEDVYVCPADCQGDEPPVVVQPPAQNTTPTVPLPQVCGDGVCSVTESQASCPQDCGQAVVTGQQGGTGAVQGQTGQGNQSGAGTAQGAAQGGDNTMLIIIIAAIAAVVIVAVLLFMMKSKGGAPKAPKPAQPKEPVKWKPETQMKCPKCGAESPPGSVFCQGCGQKLG